MVQPIQEYAAAAAHSLYQIGSFFSLNVLAPILASLVFVLRLPSHLLQSRWLKASNPEDSPRGGSRTKVEVMERSTTFNSFPEFAKEIRLIIWECAIPPRNTASVWHDGSKLVARYRIPTVLHVNQESRAVGQNMMPRILDLELSGNPIYFRLDQDLLCFPRSWGFHRLTGWAREHGHKLELIHHYFKGTSMLKHVCIGNDNTRSLETSKNILSRLENAQTVLFDTSKHELPPLYFDGNGKGWGSKTGENYSWGGTFTDVGHFARYDMYESQQALKKKIRAIEKHVTNIELMKKEDLAGVMRHYREFSKLNKEAKRPVLVGETNIGQEAIIKAWIEA